MNPSEINITEHTFRQKAIDVMNQLIQTSPALHAHFEQVETELSVKVDGQSVFCDGLIWQNKQQHKFALEFETKQPKFDASDFEVVNNAFQKAAALGVEYFATWNVRDFILWKTLEKNTPLMQRQKMIWRDIVTLPKNNLNAIDSKENWAKIETFLRDFLTTFSQILEQPASFVGVPIDEFFVFKLQRSVEINVPAFADALQHVCQKNPSYYKKLLSWVKEQGWHNVIENWENAQQVSWDFYADLARIAIFIIVNKVIFYHVVRTHYPNQLAEMIISVKTGDALQEQLQHYFNQVLKIDYQSLFAPTVFDELTIPDDAVEQLSRLINELRRYDFKGLNYEVLGRVYETLIPLEHRHDMGQYFTPSNRVDFIVGYCVRKQNHIVADWSCGAGTFLVRSYSRLKYLAQQQVTTHKQLLEQLWGCDIAKFPAHLAMMNLAMLDLSERENFPYIKNCDAFDILPQQGKFTTHKHKGVRHQFRDISGSNMIEVRVPTLDAIVGNPPYIRQEKIENKEKLEQIVGRAWGKDFTLNKQADIYAYFFLHNASFLREGGRLGFVTSNSWLDVRYGAKMQANFCQFFKIIAIVGSQVERDFSQADVNSVITILERCSDQTARESHLVKFISLKIKFDQLIPPRKSHEDHLRWHDVDALLAKFEQLDDFYEDDTIRVMVINQRALYEEGLEENENNKKVKQHYGGNKWGGKYLRAPDIFFKILEKGKNCLIPLKSIAEVRFGIKTGANEFFYLTNEETKAWGIEDEFLKPVIKSPREAEAILIDPNKLKYKILLCHGTKSELQGKNVLKYIEAGEEKFSQVPTCSSRINWYDLGHWNPPDLFWSDAYNDRFACFINPSDLFGDKRFFFIKFLSTQDKEIYTAYLNSSLISLFIEIGGITNLGEGAIYTNVYWLKSLPIIRTEKINDLQKDSLRAVLSTMQQRKVLSIFEEIHQEDRKTLDNLIFDILELNSNERQAVYDAVCSLVENRLTKSKSVAKNVTKSKKSFDIETFTNYILGELWKVQPQRIFPKDFCEVTWKMQLIELPTLENATTVQIESFFGTAVLIVDNHRIECETPSKARLLQLYLQNKKIPPFEIPMSDEHCRRACSEYDKYQKRLRNEIDELLKLENLNRKQTEQVRKAVINQL